MNQRTAFYRKIAYGAAMALLLFPISLLSSPRTKADKGGVLAQLRDEYELGQADLGEIDPASETMKLATLGLRGVAVNLLWGQANEYKKTENWSKLTATLDQLAKLQPNFITFWKFQAWNQSYNLSVEFDDYRDRYYYVRRGIEFMEKGESYNRDNPQLLWELGWFLGYKIGKADEKEQYRRLFKADDEYHKNRPLDRRDNWLVGKEWYEKSVVAADDKGRGIGRKSPVVFYSSAPKWQMNYAADIEEDGEFERALEAWRLAETEWRDFGARPVQHSQGDILRLGSQAELEKQVAALEEQLKEMNPASAEKLKKSLDGQLTPEQRAALVKPVEQRSEEEFSLAYEAGRMLDYEPSALAQQIASDEPELKIKAMSLAANLELKERLLQFTKNYKDTANYDYWLTRTEFEQTPAALEARELIFRADQAFREDLEPETAKPLYEEAFRKWRLVFDEFPVLLDPEGTTGDDIFIFIRDYNRVLEQLDEEIPDDFPLWEIIENFDLEQRMTAELARHRERMAAQRGEQAADTDADDGPVASDGEEASDEQGASEEGDEPAGDESDEDEAAGDSEAATEEEAPATGE